MGVDGFFEGFRIQFEVFKGGNRDEFAAVVSGVKTVFYEIRGGAENFISGAEDSSEKDVQSTGGTAADDHIGPR